MPKYARFDSSTVQPSPVLGWYDTDLFKYPNLPSPQDLLEIQLDRWPSFSDRAEKKWAVENGGLVPHTPPPKPTLEEPLDRFALLEARVAELEKRITDSKSKKSA